MSGWDIVIGVVGKPSAGKSTFFNAVTEGNLAKVGNFPFTTIEPNTGVTYYTTECACKSRGRILDCKPFYGRCVNGTRFIPIKLLDVAGLIPGASTGLGLGNQFLDDLRAADVLIHVIDASGETNEKGENTKGYDPTRDVQWLKEEIHLWIFNNLRNRWSLIVAKHKAQQLRETPPSICDTLHMQLSGYGTSRSMVIPPLRVATEGNPLSEQIERLVTDLCIPPKADMSSWGQEQLHKLVDAFMRIRFPTILILNKADRADSPSNIMKICAKYPEMKTVVCSAFVECHLNKLVSQNIICYNRLTSTIQTFQEDSSLPVLGDSDLKLIQKIRDRIIYRFGSTGVWDAVNLAVRERHPVVCFPVTSFSTYSAAHGEKHVFGHCLLLKRGTTVQKMVYMLRPDLVKELQYGESEDGKQISVDSEISDGLVLRLITTSDASC